MKGTIRIAVANKKRLAVDAELFGVVAVVDQYQFTGMKCYSITHVKTGYALGTHIYNLNKARKLAIMINEHAAEFTGLSTKKNSRRNEIAAELFKHLWLKVGLARYW